MIVGTLSRGRAVHSVSTPDAALAQLVSRCADQDVAALELLYRRTSPWISHLIAQRTMSPTDTDDTPLLEVRTISLTASVEETTDLADDHG